MGWQLICEVTTPTRHDTEEVVVATYADQNLARWWAVSFCQRGSVPSNQGQSNEDLIPIQHVVKFKLREETP